MVYQITQTQHNRVSKNPSLNGVKDVNALMDALQSIDKLVISKDKRLILGYYYTLNYLCNLVEYGTQPKQVTDKEKDFIKSLKESGYTLTEISLIVDRSKSTIHELQS